MELIYECQQKRTIDVISFVRDVFIDFPENSKALSFRERNMRTIYFLNIFRNQAQICTTMT